MYVAFINVAFVHVVLGVNMQSGEKNSCSKELPCDTQGNVNANALSVVPYDENNISPFYIPVRHFIVAGHDVSVKQNWAELGVAAVVWDAAVVLCEYLEQHDDLVSGRTVIELGAGSGLVGIAAAYLGGHVTITERDVALTYLQSIVQENINIEKYSVKVLPLDWTGNLNGFREPYDVILGADIIYIEEVFEDLLRTLLHLSDRNTVVIISCKIRYDRDKRFLDMMRKQFTLRKIFYDKSRDISIYKVKRISESE